MALEHGHGPPVVCMYTYQKIITFRDCEHLGLPGPEPSGCVAASYSQRLTRYHYLYHCPAVSGYYLSHCVCHGDTVCVTVPVFTGTGTGRPPPLAAGALYLSELMHMSESVPPGFDFRPARRV